MQANKSQNHQTWLATATTIAQQAGQIILQHYRRAETVIHTKDDDSRNLVTNADLEADAAIRAALQVAFPDHAILSEEAYQPDDEIENNIPTWLVDPIDGTSNFAHRLPFFAVSIGLHYAGQSQIGVVYAPMMDLTFSAALGQGATLNGQPIRVTEQTNIRHAIFACDWPRQQNLRGVQLATLTEIAEYAHTIRSLGCASLNLAAIAAGWLDIYFNYSLMPWDTAAGVLLVQEAGGQISGLDGSPWRAPNRSVLSSNGHLHAEAVEIIRPYLPAHQ